MMGRVDDLTDDEGRPVRPCIQCRKPLTYPSQPGDATHPACRVAHCVTAASDRWPTGGSAATGRMSGWPGCGSTGSYAAPVARTALGRP
jgi:hypothetical protein